MKLAEALILRADLQKRMEQLRQRLADNALTQEGESPAEDPKELLQELDRCAEQLEGLIFRINLTNAQVKKDGKTMTELLAKREVLTLRVSILRHMLEAAGRKTARATHSEVKILSTVDVGALRRQTDDLSKQLRELDTAIQAANWLTDLM